MSNVDIPHEFTGSIIKEETIKSLPKKGISNTAIYEVVDAYPGYYGLESHGDNSNFIYFETKKKNSYEKVKRCEAKIKSYFDGSFDLASGGLDVFNEIFPVIRLKFIHGYDHIKDIQMALRDEGIKFAKKKKLHRKALIKTDKVFLVKEVEQGIYADQDEAEIFYIRLPRHLKWKRFEVVTKDLKNNWSEKGFDAALAHFNRKEGIEDLVRIYTKDADISLIKHIQEAYRKRILK